MKKLEKSGKSKAFADEEKQGFSKLGLSAALLRSIEKLNITEPTEVQAKSIPHIMAGKDVVGESATGSGKTIAFGCGIAETVKAKEGIQALILTPTRELAEQVKDALKKLYNSLKIMAIYGGVSINPQIQYLPSADVVVATPGRLLDHMGRETIDLSRLKLLVLDEADRMLDMGFINDVERIMKSCPENRQTLFFSATISSEIRDLAADYMDNPEVISVAKHVDPSKLKQVYYDVRKNIKLSLLVHLLKEEKSKLVMVFCNTRRNTDFVTKNLRSNDVKAVAIHGGLTQNKRTKTIKLFNGDRAGVLVCTDVAARGLHIENVSHIYNYEIPKDANDYVHRIGRTARAGEEGKAINLLCDYDHENYTKIRDRYPDFNIEHMDTPQVKRVLAIRPPDRRGRNGGSRGRFQGRRDFNGRIRRFN